VSVIPIPAGTGYTMHVRPSWKQDGVLGDESKDWAFGGKQYVNGEVEN